MGEFGRPHGIRGEIRLRSFTADPAGILEYGPFDTGDGRSVAIETLRAASGSATTTAIASVAGVRSRSDAQALSGTKLYVPRSRLPASHNAEEFYQADLVGLRAEDEGGRAVGTVVAVYDFGAGDLLEIAETGGAKTVMVAFTRAFVPVVDIAGGRIVLTAPDIFADLPARHREP